MPTIKLYNTLTKQKQTFKPLTKNQVGLYTCGLTVYNFAHIGNLRTYIFEDVLKRTLVLNGFKVKHVQNITDVGHLTDDADQGEDKVEKMAKNEKRTAWEIAEFYTQAFKKDLVLLNIIFPNIWCKATDHIETQINAIKKIEKNGYTYKTSDGLYFDTSRLPDYGLLSAINKAQLQPGKRVAMGEKKNSTDFALWKFSKPSDKRQMEWDSPWGRGFPGWHIECSAMANHYLGIPFDIHCGGIDHISIHHNNELAQTKAAEGKLMANYWLHCEFLLINDDKMAKSKDNFITLQTIVDQKILPAAYRYLTLNTHYRQKINFTWHSLKQAQSALLKIYNHLQNFTATGKILSDYQAKFLTAINDDLNTPQALAVLWDLLKSNESLNDKTATIFYFDKVFGLNLEKNLKNYKKNSNLATEIKKILTNRATARKNKNWDLADELRKKIIQAGYTIVDTKSEQIVTKDITVEDLWKNID